MQQLGALRQERKNVVFVSNLLPRSAPDDSDARAASGPALPKAGITRGRVGIGNADDGARRTSRTARRSASGWRRWTSRSATGELLRDARQENVTFYVIPGGLQGRARRTA